MNLRRNVASERIQLRTMVGVGALTAFAGITMLAQEVVIANHFAISSEVDAYQLAVSVPSLLVNVLAGGTLLAVLVPEFSRLALNQDNSEIAALICHVRRTLGALLAACVISWIVLYPLLTPTSATVHATTSVLTNHLLWLVTPILYFVGLASIDVAYLNSRGRFLAASIFPALMPLGAITFTIIFFEKLHIYSTGAGLLFGGICQWLIGRWLTRPLLPKRLVNQRPTLPDNLRVHYGHNIISSVSLAGIIATDVFLASHQNPGDLAVYNYASRPVTLFLAFFTASIGNVILPTFSQLVNEENWDQLRQRARFWICATTCISLVCAAIWSSTCENIVSLLYQRGAFLASDTQKVAEIQRMYLLQVPFYLVAVIGVRLLNSLRLHRSLALINLIAFFVNLVVDIWLSPTLGLKGITIGTNAAFIIWAILIVSCAIKATHRAASTSHNAR